MAKHGKFAIGLMVFVVILGLVAVAFPFVAPAISTAIALTLTLKTVLWATGSVLALVAGGGTKKLTSMRSACQDEIKQTTQERDDAQQEQQEIGDKLTRHQTDLTSATFSSFFPQADGADSVLNDGVEELQVSKSVVVV